MKTTELKKLIREEIRKVIKEEATASEILSLLAHPDIKRNLDKLSDRLEDSEFMAIKKLYDGLYAELKKYE